MISYVQVVSCLASRSRTSCLFLQWRKVLDQSGPPRPVQVAAVTLDVRSVLYISSVLLCSVLLLQAALFSPPLMLWVYRDALMGAQCHLVEAPCTEAASAACVGPHLRL